VESADVIVIGAGLAGCSVAWHLAPHFKVLVLDQAEQPGAEATSQNAGMIRLLGEDPWERALAVRTAGFLEDPSPDWEGLDLSRRTGALLGLVHEPMHLHDGVAHLRARGVHVQACDRPGDVSPALGQSRLSIAWYLPEERIADPHALLTGFLAGARRNKAQLRCGVQVEELRREGSRLVGVQTNKGFFAADRVVIAAGAWSQSLALTAGISRPLVPLARTLLYSKPHPFSSPQHPWTWIDDVGIYVRPEAGGWLSSPCDETLSLPSSGPGSKGPVDPYHRALAVDKIERYMPALGEVTFAGGWTGLRTFAPDRRPILGADPELDGLWWAAGLGGSGLTCSYGVGEAVSAWMRGLPTDWLEHTGVSPARAFLSRWPIRPEGDLVQVKLIASA
jgi:D-arginine dehydrogenase